MKTDPRKACANLDEHLFWALVHDLIAHPLMALTCWAPWTVRFHDWTSFRAWPRAGSTPTGFYVSRHFHGFGWLRADEVGPSIWTIRHPRANHTLTVGAPSGYEALTRAAEWFGELADEFGGKFAREDGQ